MFPSTNSWRRDSPFPEPKHFALTNTCLWHPCITTFLPGDRLAPYLSLDLLSAQPGDTLLAWCFILTESPATRIVFCKDGVEEYSLKAQHGQLSYSVLLNVTLGSTGMYMCGYQHRNESNWVRSSALSAPRYLTVTGEMWHWGMGWYNSWAPLTPFEGEDPTLPHGMCWGSWDAQYTREFQLSLFQLLPCTGEHPAPA